MKNLLDEFNRKLDIIKENTSKHKVSNRSTKMKQTKKKDWRKNTVAMKCGQLQEIQGSEGNFTWYPCLGSDSFTGVHVLKLIKLYLVNRFSL